MEQRFVDRRCRAYMTCHFASPHSRCRWSRIYFHPGHARSHQGRGIGRVINSIAQPRQGIAEERVTNHAPLQVQQRAVRGRIGVVAQPFVAVAGADQQPGEVDEVRPTDNGSPVETVVHHCLAWAFAIGGPPGAMKRRLP